MLVLHAGSLGDCVLALHLSVGLARVRSMSITLVARSGFAEWAAEQGFAEQACRLEYEPVREIFQPETNVSLASRQWFGGFDWLVSFLGPATSVAGRRLSALVPHRAVHIDPRADERPEQPARHIVLQWADQVVRQGLDVNLKTTLEPIPAPMNRTASRLAPSARLRTRGASILLHPGSGGLHKCLPIDRLERLIEVIKSDNEASPAWIVGPDEMERHGADLVGRLERSAPVFFEESVALAADLIAEADAYIGHDAGMTHVAAMLGVPTLALFGPTNPHVWRPIGRAVHIVPFPQAGDDRRWMNELVAIIDRCVDSV
jgi:heptosyltransferase-3